MNNNNQNNHSPPLLAASSCSVPAKRSPTVPVKTYFNAKADKAQILSDNKNKSGIYMFKNLNNGKQYIGSSNNLKKKIYGIF